MRCLLKKIAYALIDVMVRNDCFIFRPTMIERIGHFAGEVDLWLKERALQGKRGKAFALIACAESAANAHLLTYFRDHFHFVISPSLWNRLTTRVWALNRLIIERPDYYVAINETANCWPTYAAWGARAPLFRLRDDDRDSLRTVLRGWGLQEDAWFVCLHNRERGYSPTDDDLHDYRNAPIDTYLLAIHEITKRGGWVIRMGDPNMTPLPLLPQVIDYVHSRHRSPRLDICLCASARFFLGCGSGLSGVAPLFGVPTASAHLAFMSLTGLTPSDIGIPKMVSSANGRMLPFAEVMESPVANYRFTRQFQEAGLQVIPNSAEEIKGLVVEILERMEGTCKYTEVDEALQKRFHSLFRPGHFGYGSLARTGREFLRAHRGLLPDKPGDGLGG